MTIRLTIGITHDTSTLAHSLFESIGLLLEFIEQQPTSQSHACIFASNPNDFSAYAYSGGVVLGPHGAWPSDAIPLVPTKTPFALHDMGWNTLETPDSDAAHLSLRVARYGLGGFVEIPHPLFDYWNDTRLGHKLFNCGEGIPPYASEVTSLMDKGNIQRTLILAFQRAHALRKLPFVTKHRYPNGASSIFCYRFDCDGEGADDIEKVVTLFEKDLSHQAYFFNVSTYTDRPDLVHLITERGGTVDSHNYVHTVFNNALLEQRNIRLAHNWISQHRIGSPQGFVCPGSGYNPSVLPMLERLGYRHYASFGFDYDTLPHRLTAGGATGKLWNIAFHPVSLGRLLRGLNCFDKATIMDYYRKTIQQKIKRQDPLFFYCHPEGRIGKYPSIYAGIRDIALSDSTVFPLSLMQYVEYLDKQTAIAPEVSFISKSNQLRIQNSDIWESARATLYLHDNHQSPLTMDETITLPDTPQKPLEMLHGVGDTITRPLLKTLDEARGTVRYNQHDDWRLAARVLFPHTTRLLKSVRPLFKRDN